jgi:hypothetical protein
MGFLGPRFARGLAKRFDAPTAVSRVVIWHASITSRRGEDDLMPRFETEMEVCPDCRRTTEATVEYIRDSDGNVIRRLVRDINCRYADCPGSEVPPHWR